jgi:hypothetical protein
MSDEERIHEAKLDLRKIGYTLLRTQDDDNRFVVAHLGSETVVNDPTTLDGLAKLVQELKEEAWRRA